jgi:REP element-mobilizing transposase RayT
MERQAANPVERTFAPAEPEFWRYFGHLPHWRLTGAIYFATWKLHKVQTDLVPDERDQIVMALRHFDGDRYQLLGFVVMNDHVHVLVQPLRGAALERILHSWKSFTARQFQRAGGRKGAVWQKESFDRIVRNEAELWEKAAYILGNPRKRWPGITDYAWVWLRHSDEGGEAAAHAKGRNDKGAQ